MNKESKLDRHLKSLSPKEWNQFIAWVHSPFHNTHQETREFFQALQPHFPDFTYEDEIVFEQAFPNRPYDHARLKILKSYLLKLVRKFFVQLEYEQDALYQERSLLTSLANRNLLQDAAQQMGRSLQLASEASSPDLAEHQYYLHRSALDLQVRDSTRLKPVDFSTLLTSLDIFSLSHKLRVLASHIGNSYVQQQTLPWEDIESTLSHVKRSQLEEHPAVGPYYILVQLMRGRQENEAELVNELYRMVEEGGDAWEKSDLVNLFGLLNNKFFLDLSQGKPDSRLKVFQNYQRMAARDLIFGQGMFSVATCGNIVSISARLGEYEWAEQILAEARQRLPEEFRENIYHNGLARLAFNQRRFSDAKKHLLKVDYFDFYYKLINDLLLLRVYYELEDAIGFHALHPTIARFINRKKGLPDSFVRMRKNFLKATRMMFDHRDQPVKKQRPDQLEAKLAALRPAILTDWLDAKQAELPST